ncbi:hypothetical protein SAMN05428988_4071 [Chitinophaga sp. YR573]|uniref:hypothetical protein n=1 Tax=Chitinophaga sp. YR573 TaxID=1881040 RepID=UPI0008BA9CB3|nr:hypothetical protein [Chitinophaga sp. YR573]SEW29425.1 hypothetical protein SAMN05428988_4071 [Chitinophaga sp. YR573]
MKRLFVAALTAAVLVMSISCSKDSKETAAPSVASLRAELSKLSTTPATENTVITDMSKPFMTNIDTKKLHLLNQINALTGVTTMGLVGPLTVTGNLRLIASNQRVTITNAEAPTLATGVYICDVYTVYAEVSLPANSAGIVNYDLMARYGYSNWTTKLRGVLSSQSTGPTGNILALTTYSVLPRYNVLGQAVGAPAIPAGDLTGLQFVYSYYEF